MRPTIYNPRRISTHDLLTTARAFHAAGLLSAQSPRGDCELTTIEDGDGYNCAIGAVMTATEIRAAIDTTVFGLSRQRIVLFEDSELALQLQIAHDQWARYRTPHYEARFLEILDNPEDFRPEAEVE